MKCPQAMAAALAAFFLLVPNAAQTQKQRQEPKKTAGEKVREALPPAERVFTKEERIKITTWLRDNRSGLPPGLAKREKLPPGLAKQLRERGKLPPGLQKKIQPLPPLLEKELRILPTGYRRVVIAGNVVLINEKTTVIYDIIRNAIP